MASLCVLCGKNNNLDLNNRCVNGCNFKCINCNQIGTNSQNFKCIIDFHTKIYKGDTSYNVKKLYFCCANGCQHSSS